MKKSLILFVVIAAVVIGFFLWWQNGNSPVDSRDESSKIFVIAEGAAVRAIASDLKEQELIRDPVVFFLYIKKSNLATKIQAGSHRLSPSMSLKQLVDSLQTGSIDVWVTIPEGYRSEQIAEVLSENLETYDKSWITALKKEEGFLFPDTYLIPKDADVETVISIMRNNFNTRVSEIGIDPESSSIREVITKASLIEREAITDEEKPIISSVITNRLEDGMGLDIDATLQYITGKSGSWWEVPTGEERAIDSPYNTYRYTGLPPTPIANPGIVAIQAALNPEDSPYYFYIHDPEGNVHFAETLDEHNENIEQYLN